MVTCNSNNIYIDAHKKRKKTTNHSTNNELITEEEKKGTFMYIYIFSYTKQASTFHGITCQQRPFLSAASHHILYHFMGYYVTISYDNFRGGRNSNFRSSVTIPNIQSTGICNGCIPSISVRNNNYFSIDSISFGIRIACVLVCLYSCHTPAHI